MIADFEMRCGQVPDDPLLLHDAAHRVDDLESVLLYDPIVPVSGTGYIPAELIETQQADNQNAAKAALAGVLESMRQRRRQREGNQQERRICTI